MHRSIACQDTASPALDREDALVLRGELIERTFGETRRRVKVIGRLPGEASCLSLVWAVLDRASKGWRGLRYTSAIARHLTDVRHQLKRPNTGEDDPITGSAEIVIPAA